jgi:phosphatidylglycerophosphatase C
MQLIAIYDLDRTILSRPTFTPFLIFAAKRLKPWRLLLLPIWITAMIGYKLRLYDRKPMKQFGIRLFIGRDIIGPTANILAHEFASKCVPSDVQPGAAARIANDRVLDAKLVMATAAPEIYAGEIGRLIAFDAVIATRHLRLADGGYRNLFADENCYGPHKLARVKEWMAAQGLDRASCHVRFYTDHHSDAPVLDWADEGVIVNGDAKLTKMAQQRGWRSENWR